MLCELRNRDTRPIRQIEPRAASALSASWTGAGGIECEKCGLQPEQHHERPQDERNDGRQDRMVHVRHQYRGLKGKSTVRAPTVIASGTDLEQSSSGSMTALIKSLDSGETCHAS